MPSLLISTVVNILLNGIVFLVCFLRSHPHNSFIKCYYSRHFCYEYIVKMCKNISNDDYSQLSHFLQHTFVFLCFFSIRNFSTKIKLSKKFFFSISLVKITDKIFWLLFHLARYSTRISSLCTLRKLFLLLDDILQKDVQLSMLDNTFLFI